LSEVTRISDEIKSLLDNPPRFTDDERISYFTLSETQRELVDRLDTDANKIGFTVQLGYFRSSQRFYDTKNWYDFDINFIEKQFNIKPNQVKLQYADRSKIRHRKIILDSLGTMGFKDANTIFETDLKRLARGTTDPESLIKEMTLIARNSKYELPASYEFAKRINETIVTTENNFISAFNRQFESINTKEITQKFNRFIEPITRKDGSESTRPKLTQYKKISQNYKPRKLAEALDDFLLFKHLFNVVNPILQSLELSVSIIQHFAIWIIKAKTFQIKQRSEHKIQFYLACFVYHYYHLRQDALITSMVKGVTEHLNSIKREQKNINSEAQQIYGQLTQALQVSRETLKKHINQVEQIAEHKQKSSDEKINQILSILQHLKELEENKSSETKINELIGQANDIKDSIDEYVLLDKYAVKIQNRASKIIPHIEFNDQSSNPQLLDAVRYYQQKNGKISPTAPTSFLTEEEVDKLYNEDNHFQISLYKALLITKTVEAIKSGVINLKHSYKYLTLQKYLIPKNDWDSHKATYLKEAKLEDFIDIKKLLISLCSRLGFHYRNTNDHIISGENHFVRFDKKGKAIVRTPGVPKLNNEKMADLFKDAKYISILDILNQVNQSESFTKCFKHHSVAAPKVKPINEVFYAALIGIGCNIGIHKFAVTAKGISLNKIENVTNWYINKEGLYKANHQIIQAIDKLSLPNILLGSNNIKHGSSDGMQTEITRDSLNSNQSYKYSGLAKGVSIYSFIDNRCVLFYSTVISPEEREAAYVIDGLFHNDEVKMDIHSTDTHGFSEIIFAVTFLLKIAFAPRIKSLYKQALYSFESPSYYQKLGYKLCPKKIIQQSKIENHWDEVLRLVASIKLRYATASQIFKRLSSYSLENPLYTALKQFGRIIKSIFILVYYQDLELRQSIQKQLNLVELSNKFSKAVFFDHNSEFKIQETKEEQEIAVLCKQLIQNAIIYWNYCYLTQKLINAPNSEEIQCLMQVMLSGTVMNWAHVNMYGEYDFRNIDESPNRFDMLAILSYKAKNGDKE
jgi:TnpA family transposase